MIRLTRDGTGGNKFSGANGDKEMEIFIFPVQLTASRIGNLTRLIHGRDKLNETANYTLLYLMTMHT